MISFQVTMDCADPNRLAMFWAELIGYKIQDPPPGFATWQDWLREQKIPEAEWNNFSAIVDPEGKGARFFFQRVPEPKTAKNRVHLDVNAGGPHGTPPEERARNVADAVERALKLGAQVLYEMDQMGEHWVTLADPEGNEFCIQ